IRQAAWSWKLRELLAFYGPAERGAQDAPGSDEPLGGLAIALQLPVEPGRSDPGPVAAIGHVERAAMADRQVRQHDRNVIDPREIVRPVGEGDVLRPTQDIGDGGVQALQRVLVDPDAARAGARLVIDP